MKMADGDESRWMQHAYHAIWAEQVTIQRSTGYSPYYMVHGVHPLLPFDITEQTFLHPTTGDRVSQAELLAICSQALQRRAEDLGCIRELVTKSRLWSVEEFVKRYQNTI